MQPCRVCLQDKDWDCFSKQVRLKSGFKKTCKECVRVQSRSYYRANADRYGETSRKWTERHREKVLRYQSAYRKLNKGRIVGQIRAAHRKRLKEDVQYKLACALRRRLGHALKGSFKSGSAVNDLGCSVADLKLHLESKFEPGMSWENWNPNGWHVDHIKPLASFDLTDRSQLLQACHFSNLQPLWAAQNVRKSNRVVSLCL